MKNQNIICPCCKKTIKLIICKSRIKVDTTFFNNQNQELSKKLEELGYEFGEKVGETNGKNECIFIK